MIQQLKFTSNSTFVFFSPFVEQNEQGKKKKKW